jgi:hypothetical protein
MGHVVRCAAMALNCRCRARSRVRLSRLSRWFHGPQPKGFPMKRILAVGLALMVFFFWLFDVLSQDRIELKASDKQRTIAGASLQEEYVSRQRLKAAMMSEEEIRETLQVLDREIIDLQSTKRFEDVVNSLEAFIAENPGTQAKPIAEEMLKVYRDKARK